MKLRHLIVIASIIILLGFAVVIQLGRGDTEGQFCSNLPNGSIYCADSVADFFYELSGRQITFSPDDIQLGQAIQTYGAYAQAHNIPQPNMRLPTAPPPPPGLAENIVDSVEQFLYDIRNPPIAPSPSSTLGIDGTKIHCSNSPLEGEKCFASEVELVEYMYGGLITIVPKSLSFFEADATYRAFLETTRTSTPSNTPGEIFFNLTVTARVSQQTPGN